jgi:hypothetical protein
MHGPRNKIIRLVELFPPRNSGFFSWPVYVEFLAYEYSIEQVSLRIIQFSPTIIIPSFLDIYSTQKLKDSLNNKFNKECEWQSFVNWYPFVCQEGQTKAMNKFRASSFMADVYKTRYFQNVNQETVLSPTRKLSSIGWNRLQSVFLVLNSHRALYISAVP